MTSGIEKTVDRGAVRAIAEDFWRSSFAIVRQNPKMEKDLPRQFTERINAMTGLMPPGQAKEFCRIMDEERDLLLDERDRDPEAFQRRLGVPSRQPAMSYRRQGIGEMAVRTAVRASIWEVIFRLFRH